MFNRIMLKVSILIFEKKVAAKAEQAVDGYTFLIILELEFNNFRMTHYFYSHFLLTTLYYICLYKM